jgi:flagellar hook-associated protein 2
MEEDMADFQISGITSGIDWGEIIDQMISNRRTVQVQWLETKETINSRSYLYSELVAGLGGLKSSLDPLVLESTFLGKTADVTPLSGVEAPLSVTVSPEASIASLDIDVSSVAKNHRVAGGRVEDISSSLGLSGSFSLSVGDSETTVEIAAGDSLSDVAGAINDAAAESAGAGFAPAMTARILDNTLVISSSVTGADFGLTVSGDDDNILQGLGVWNVGGSGEFARVLQVPVDAVFEMDGLEITRSSNSVDDLLEGVTFEIASEGSARVDISLDAGAAVESARAMTEAYNEVMDWVNVRLSEKTVDEPQSDLERRRGLLNGDPLLWNCKHNMRNITGKPRSLSNGESRLLSFAGISTESVDYGKSGKLQFDETAFMEAMLDDPGSVMEMVRSFAVEMKTFTEGMISRSTISVGGTTAIKGRIYSQIDTLERQSLDIDRRVADFEARLEMEKASLEALYSNMESRIAMISKQASYITSLSQLGNYGSDSDS